MMSAASVVTLVVVVVVVGADLSYEWQPVVFGGGGYVTGLTFHPTVSGLVYARTDVGGAYRRDPGSRTWTQLLDVTSRPDSDLLAVLSLAVDATDPERLYLAAGMYTQSWARTAALWRSADRGRTWARTELPFRLGGNEDGRGAGERLQVDPNLGSVLWLGTSRDGLWRSPDHGLTWTPITSCPVTSVTFVRVDGGSGPVGAASPRLYIGAADPAAPLWTSADGGLSWTLVKGPGRGQFPLAAALDGAGRLYLTFSNALGPNGATNGSVLALDTGTWRWTDVTPASGVVSAFGGVSVSSQSPSLVTVSSLDRWSVGDTIWRSTNGGRTWVEIDRSVGTHPTPATGAGRWMREAAVGHWITDVEIDPFDDQHALYVTGQGLWETDAFLCRRCPWTFSVDGLEETVVMSLTAPASAPATLFVTVGDVGGGRYGANRTDLRPFTEAVGTTRALDAAHWWPYFAARTTDSAAMAYLTFDNGLTWQPIAARPVQSTSNAGRIAIAAGGGAMVWAVPGYGAWTSADNGASWANATGYPVSDPGRFFAPIADRAANNVFYTYDYGRGQLLESTDAGRTFAVVYTGLDTMPTWASQHQLLSVPTQPRDLWLATPKGLYRFAGRAASAPSPLANVTAAYAIGYGAAAPGAAYPTLFLSATVSGVTGLFRSVDAARTWIRIDSDQQRLAVDLLVGDPRVFGRLFVAPAGRGVRQGTPSV